MYLTHRFGSLETLDRARYWLIRHGFEVDQSDEAEHDETRLTMRLDLSEVSAALALIDSIEQTDPAGWPGWLDGPRTVHAHAPHARPVSGSVPGSTPIHWQGRQDHPASDPLCCKVCEYMLSRWE